MTSAEMIRAFVVGYDIANHDGPPYEEPEILVFLNTAIEVEVQKEISINRFTNITNLIEHEIGKATANILEPYTGVYRYSLTKSSFKIIGCKSKISRATYKPMTTLQWVNCTPINKEDSGRYITNNLNRPVLLSPPYYENEDNSVSIIIDSLTSLDATTNISVEYIRKPITISVSQEPDVDNNLHERIVDTAIKLAKKVFNPNEASGDVQTDMLIKKDLQ